MPLEIGRHPAGERDRAASSLGLGRLELSSDVLRAALEGEMPRLPLSYFEASVPMPDGWTRRPCAYLLLGADPYAQSAREARALGWPVREVHGVQHLAIATDPLPVTEALLDLERALHQSIR